MKKKGFTLVELLAVIVVLVVIALIAVPIVLNIIKKAREGAAIASARSYIKATETYVVSSELNKKNTLLKGNKYNVTSSTTIEGITYQAINNLVEIKGSKPSGSEDYITLGTTYQVVEAKLTINGYEILIKNDEVISIAKGKAIEVEGITLDKETVNIEIEKTVQLTATITPDNASNKSVTWTSSNEEVAIVDSKGLVTGVKEGSVTITATTSNGKTATASIDVYKAELLSDVVSIGDYVDYDAGEWISTAVRPTSYGNFGGYTKGENKAVSICGSLKGWRVLSINKNTNTVIIIHAGVPELYYYETGYASDSVKKFNDRAISQYLNRNYADSAHMMNRSEVETIPQSNTLRNFRYHYWLASYENSAALNVITDEGAVEKWGTYGGGGPRPVVVLKPNIKTAGKTTDKVGQQAWSLIK